ncbi:hypothetical protein V8J83_09570 [Gymnodinialimonas sp. 2307UL20-7]
MPDLKRLHPDRRDRPDLARARIDRHHHTDIRADPTQGTALYMMVTITLLPTFVHLIAGLGAMFSYRSRALAAQADILADNRETGAELTVIERGDMVGRARRIRWVAYACALTLTAILAALVLDPIRCLTVGQG